MVRRVIRQSIFALTQSVPNIVIPTILEVERRLPHESIFVDNGMSSPFKWFHRFYTNDFNRRKDHEARRHDFFYNQARLPGSGLDKYFGKVQGKGCADVYFYHGLCRSTNRPYAKLVFSGLQNDTSQRIWEDNWGIMMALGYHTFEEYKRYRYEILKNANVS